MVRNETERSDSSYKPVLNRRKFLQVLGVSLAVGAPQLLLSKSVYAQNDRPASDRPISPAGPDVPSGPDSSRIVTIEQLLSAEEIDKRIKIIKPRFITEYQGKDLSGVSEDLAKASFQRYIAGAQAYGMAGIAEAAKWVQNMVSEQVNPSKNTANGMTFMDNFQYKGYSRIGLMATPDGCSVDSPSRTSAQCPPVDPNNLIDVFRIQSVDDRGVFFINHELVVGNGVEADPRDIEQLVRLVQMKEGVITTNRIIERIVAIGGAPDLVSANQEARAHSWLSALNSAKTLKAALPKDWWNESPQFANFYDGYSRGYEQGGEAEALKYIKDNELFKITP